MDSSSLVFQQGQAIRGTLAAEEFKRTGRKTSQADKLFDQTSQVRIAVTALHCLLNAKSMEAPTLRN